MTRAAKPAMPFKEELALDLLATLAKAARLTCTGELRRNFLVDGRLWSRVESSSAEDGDEDGLAFLLSFPLEEQRCMRLAERVEAEVFVFKRMVGVKFNANPSVTSQFIYSRNSKNKNVD